MNEVVTSFSMLLRGRGFVEQSLSLTIGCADVRAHCFSSEKLGIVLVAPPPGTAFDDLSNALKDVGNENTLRDIPGHSLLVCPVGSAAVPLGGVSLGRGIALVGMHDTIAQAVGLPDGWRDGQRTLLEQALEPVANEDRVEVARLYAWTPHGRLDAFEWLAGSIGSLSPDGHFWYVRAEAGKGKSTVLGEVARRILERGEGPLPLFVPLRMLQRGSGISWDAIVACAGVIGGPVTHQLANAVRAGLVTPVLDGLDEVSGRYDPSLVQSVINVIADEVEGDASKIVMSGRTTEASLLEEGVAIEVGLELPDPSDEAFADYARLVIARITPGWPSIAARIPEPPYSEKSLADSAPTDQQSQVLLDWLRRVFDELGKERSLFFVQSLACVGRTHQLEGNQPILIRDRNEPALRVPLYDVCILAAALASVREQDKIEQIARSDFSPVGQLDLLTWLALRSAPESSVRERFPQPNELIQKVFRIDPVNQNEEFTAVVRQMHKHALLFAGIAGGLRAGDWRPQFLSEWVRDALLLRAWLGRDRLEAVVDRETISQAVLRAEKARPLYESLIPDLLARTEGPRLDIDELVAGLIAEADQESPEACANYWRLVAGMRGQPRELPRVDKVVPFTDLSELGMEYVDFGPEFSGTLAILSGAGFEACSFSDSSWSQFDVAGVTFTNCEFTAVSFIQCEGSVRFDGCVFRACNFENHKGAPPGLHFEACQFLEGSAILQSQPPHGPETFGPVASFENCRIDRDVETLATGDWVGIEKLTPRQVRRMVEAPDVAPEREALRLLLGYFFPRGEGAGQHHQARGYIRSSALGRGSWPEGSPGAAALEEILTGVGFTDGGREGHIYAPWSSVVGRNEAALELRNEFLTYLLHGEVGPTVASMLTRIRKAGDW